MGIDYDDGPAMAARLEQTRSAVLDVIRESPAWFVLAIHEGVPWQNITLGGPEEFAENAGGLARRFLQEVIHRAEDAIIQLDEWERPKE